MTQSETEALLDNHDSRVFLSEARTVLAQTLTTDSVVFGIRPTCVASERPDLDQAADARRTYVQTRARFGIE